MDPEETFRVTRASSTPRGAPVVDLSFGRYSSSGASTDHDASQSCTPRRGMARPTTVTAPVDTLIVIASTSVPGERKKDYEIRQPSQLQCDSVPLAHLLASLKRAASRGASPTAWRGDHMRCLASHCLGETRSSRLLGSSQRPTAHRRHRDQHQKQSCKMRLKVGCPAARNT